MKASHSSSCSASRQRGASPNAARAWLLLIFMFPYIGTVVFLLLRVAPGDPVAEGEDDLFAGIPTDVAAADALATSGDLTVALDTRTEREA